MGLPDPNYPTAFGRQSGSGFSCSGVSAKGRIHITRHSIQQDPHLQ